MHAKENKNRIGERKLKSVLKKNEALAHEALELRNKVGILQPRNTGFIEPENSLEKTHRISQRDIAASVPLSSAYKSFSLNLEDGPYCLDYTRNGRYLLLGGKSGHVGAFDWKSGKMLCEISLGETIHDVQWLHNENMFAVAQDKYTYIYDSNGVEIHVLRKHTEARHLEFLPFHMLLVSSGSSGILRYQDITTGKFAGIGEIKTRLGPTLSMNQNPYNAIVHLGHSRGTVTLWSPNTSTPLVKMLCHRGPVAGISLDPSGGNIMATIGADSYIKLWDLRTYNLLHSYKTPLAPSSLDISQTGLLSVSFGSSVHIWKDALREQATTPYMTHVEKGSKGIQRGLFCPYDDVLGLGHGKGFSSLLVPGAGEPNFHSLHLNPFETKKQKRESEIKSLVWKLSSDLIVLDTDAISQIRKPSGYNPPKSLPDEASPEEIEKGKKKRERRSSKKYLNKQKNVFDQKKALIKEKLEREKGSASKQAPENKGLLGRFIRKS